MAFFKPTKPRKENPVTRCISLHGTGKSSFIIGIAAVLVTGKVASTTDLEPVHTFTTRYDQFLASSCIPTSNINISAVHESYIDLLKRMNDADAIWLPIARRDLGGWQWLSGEFEGVTLVPGFPNRGHCVVLQARDMVLGDVSCNERYTKYLCQKTGSTCEANDGNCFVDDGTRYTIVVETASWYEARAGCYKRGEQLASLPKANRRRLLKKIHEMTPAFPYIWVGLRRMDYFLVNRNTSVEEYKWRKGETCPCNSPFSCLALQRTKENTFFWKPRNCSESIHSILCIQRFRPEEVTMREQVTHGKEEKTTEPHVTEEIGTPCTGEKVGLGVSICANIILVGLIIWLIFRRNYILKLKKMESTNIPAENELFAERKKRFYENAMEVDELLIFLQDALDWLKAQDQFENEEVKTRLQIFYDALCKYNRSIRRKVGDAISDGGLTALMVNITKYFKGKDTWSDECNLIYRAAISFSDASKKLAKSMAEGGMLELLLENVPNKKYDATGETFNNIVSVKRCVSILLNLAEVPELKHLLIEHKAIEALEPFMTSKLVKDDDLQAKSCMAVAHLVYESKNHILKKAASSGCIKNMTRWLADALLNNDHWARGFTAIELVDGLACLAANDQNKQRIVDAGVLPSLADMMKSSNEKEQCIAARCLLTLTFDKQTRDKIKKDQGCIDALEKLSKTTLRVKIRDIQLLYMSCKYMLSSV